VVKMLLIWFFGQKLRAEKWIDFKVCPVGCQLMNTSDLGCVVCIMCRKWLHAISFGLSLVLQVTSGAYIWHVLSAMGSCFHWRERCPVWCHETKVHWQPPAFQVCTMICFCIILLRYHSDLYLARSAGSENHYRKFSFWSNCRIWLV